MTLEELRGRIDALDERLVELLNARAACALEIGHVKQALRLDVYQPEREKEVLRHVQRCARASGGPLADEAIIRVFERIIDEARRLERAVSAADALAGPGDAQRTKASGTDRRAGPDGGRRRRK